MEIKEQGCSQIAERALSKINTVEQGIRESGNFLENLNNLNQNEEEQKEHSTPSTHVTSYLSPKEKRLWNSLSPQRRKKYEKNNVAVSKAGVEAETTSVNVAATTSTAGKGSASAVAKETASARTKETAFARTKETVSARTKEAATGAREVAGAAAGAASSGVLVAAETAKKTAQTFKDALQSRVMAQRELAQQNMEAQRKAQQTTQKRSEDENPGLKNLVYILIGSILIVVICVVTLFTAFSGEESPPIGEGIVAVAEQELSTSELNVGGLKYKDWYGLNGDWCMMFISWCANECGYIESECMPRTASVSSAKNWFISKNQYYEKKSNYIPQKGNLVFFLNGMSHVGIITSYDSEKDQITVIEGNSGRSTQTPYHSGSRVTQNVYQRNAKSISGFAAPKYSAPDISDESTVEKN